MRSQIQRVFILLFSLTFSISVVHADMTLPSPINKGGMGIFDTLKKRSSTPGGGFTIGRISDDELSTILWSASGLNRGKQGWTVPMANGSVPYVRIYIAGENGVYRYEWDGHYLQSVSQSDIRADIAQQSFTRRAAYALIFVTDNKALAEYNNNEKANNFSQMAVGAMSQNIYLAAAALKLNVRYIHSIKPEIIIDELMLPDGDLPIGLMLLGK